MRFTEFFLVINVLFRAWWALLPDLNNVSP